MSYRLLALSSLILLGACSYLKDEHIQDLTIVTPGANGSVCYAYVNKLKYKFRPPQTLNISKSDEDLVVDCLAPGNRRKQVVIRPDIANSTFGNALNGGVGAVWDYSSGAMFKYPDVVEVNFENTPTQPEALPAQNSPDIKQPEEYMLEEFSPGTPRMNSDRYREAPQILRRQRDTGNDSLLNSGYLESDVDPNAPAAAPSMDKGDIMNVIESVGPANINPSTNPSGAAQTPAAPSQAEQYGPPIPLYPGQ